MTDTIEAWKVPSPSFSRRSVIRGAGSAALGLAGASALGGLMTTTARAAFTGSRPYKIGFVAPLTGPVAPEGISMQRGFDLGLEHLNAASGIGGQKVEAVTQDTKADPAVVATVVKKFIQEEKVDMIVGTITNDEEDAVGLGSKAKWLLEDEVKKLGVEFSRGPIWQPYTVVDRNLYTGQNPASAAHLAQELLKVLN